VKQAQSGLVVATVVVEPEVPPPSSGGENLSGGQTAPEAAAAQAATESLVEASLGDSNAVATSTEQIAPPPPLAREHEVKALAAAETPVPAAAHAGGGATEVSATDTMSASILEIIDLDALDLPSNDQDIYEAMLEHILADPVESEVEAPESAVPAAATSAEAAVPANEKPMSSATAAGQLTPGQAGDVGGFVPSAPLEAAEEVLGEPVTGTELTLVAPLPPTAGWTRLQLRLWSPRLSGPTHLLTRRHPREPIPPDVARARCSREHGGGHLPGDPGDRGGLWCGPAVGT
jgi:hypothetical protein